MVSDRLGDPGWPATAGAGDATTAAGAAAVTAAAPAAASTTAVVPLVLDWGRQGCNGGGRGGDQGKEGRKGNRNSLKQTCLLAKGECCSNKLNSLSNAGHDVDLKSLFCMTCYMYLLKMKNLKPGRNVFF